MIHYILFFIYFSNASELIDRPILKVPGEVYFCKGDFVSFRQEIDGIPEGSVRRFFGEIAYLSIPSGLKDIQIKEDMATMTDGERLIAAHVTMRRNIGDEDRARSYLSISFQNPLLEIYRKVTLADLDYVKFPERSLKVMIDSFYSLPHLDPYLLERIFSLGRLDKNPDHFLPQFYKYIDALESGSSEKFLLMFQRESMDPYSQDSKIAFSYLEKSYELCPYDQEIALLYAESLLNQSKMDSVERMLREQTRKTPDTGVFEFMLGRLLIENNMGEEAASYIRVAQENKSKLTVEEQAYLEKYQGLHRENSLRWVNWGVGGVLIFLITITLYRKWRNSFEERPR